jgi:hypothetical protein
MGQVRYLRGLRPRPNSLWGEFSTYPTAPPKPERNRKRIDVEPLTVAVRLCYAREDRGERPSRNMLSVVAGWLLFLARRSATQHRWCPGVDS